MFPAVSHIYVIVFSSQQTSTCLNGSILRKDVNRKSGYAVQRALVTLLTQPAIFHMDALYFTV